MKLTREFFGLSLSKNLKLTLHELTDHWGLSLDDIEDRPMLLGASLKRIQSLREILDRFSVRLTGANFDLKKIPIKQRKQVIQSVGAPDFLNHLKAFLDIDANTPIEIDQLNVSQLRLIESLFESGDIHLFLKKKISNRDRSRLDHCKRLLEN